MEIFNKLYSRENNKYIVELKNPHYLCENRHALGQLLDYGRELPGSQLILLSTSFDFSTQATIKYYNLPIRYIYFEKTRCLECVGGCDE